MQDTTHHSNLHVGFTVRSPESISNQHYLAGTYLLNTVQDYAYMPIRLAEEISYMPLTASQKFMCGMAAKHDITLALTSPKVGVSDAVALIAWQSVLEKRDNRVLIISPSSSGFNHARAVLRHGDHELIALASATFKILGLSGIWSEDDHKWGIEWAPMHETPLWDIAEYLSGYSMIIIDDAHKYTEDFLLAVVKYKPDSTRLLIAGKDVGSGMELLGRTPGISSLRISLKEAPHVSKSFVEREKLAYKDRPDVYEQIYQVPYSWEPEKCLR